MRYLALDFETANEEKTSICSVGYALFQDDTLISSNSILVKPHPFYFSEANVCVNGITRFMTENCEPYAEVRKQLLGLDFEFIICHNASFDIPCLIETAKLQGFNAVEKPVLCTMIMASRMLSSGFLGLDKLCRFIGIEFAHHCAEADSIACGRLFNYMLAVSKCNLPEFLKKYKITEGIISCNEFTPVDYEKAGRSYTNYYAPSVNKVNLNICEPLDDSLLEKQFVFTGGMDCMGRAEAIVEVHRRGGICKNSITLKTNYLVVANESLDDLESNTPPGKIVKARQYNETKNTSIEIMSEHEFLRLLRIDR